MNPTATNPSAFKQRILSKAPDGVANDGRRYSDIPADELTKMIVTKAPNAVTNDNIPYSSFLSKNYQPQNEPERSYLNEAAKLYDRTINSWSKKGVEATSDILMDTGRAVASPLSNLALGVYATAKKKQAGKLDDEYLKSMEQFDSLINNPTTSLEKKKLLATIRNTTAPPQMLDQILGDKTAKNALFDTANSLFNTALLGFGGGLGLTTKGTIAGKGIDLSVKGGLTSYLESAAVGASKWQTAKNVIVGSLKSAGAYGGLAFGEKATEEMSQNKPIEEVLGNAAKEGFIFAGLIGAIEAGVPFLGGIKGIIARTFKATANKLGSKGADVEKILQDTEDLITQSQKMAPDSGKTGEAVLAPISLEERAARAEKEQNLKNNIAILEKDYVDPNINSQTVGTKIQTQFDDWQKSEKELADKFWGQGFFETIKGVTVNFTKTLAKLQSKFENVKAWDSFKNSLTRLAKETEDPAMREALKKWGAVVLKKSGVTIETERMTLNEMILSERGIRDLIGKETAEGYKQTAPFYSQLSKALNEDILKTLEKTDPNKAKAYIDERTRWSNFKDSLAKTKASIKSDDPLEAIFNMSPQEIESLYGVKNFQDNIAELQDGLIRHAVEKSKLADGSYDTAKLQKYIELASKNPTMLPPEDLIQLREFNDLIAITQGTSVKATQAQRNELQRLLGDNFKKLEESSQRLTDAETALKALGVKGGNVESLISESDTIINNLKGIKSAKVFASIWNKLDDVTKNNVRAVIYKNAFGESFATAQGIGAKLNSFKTYLESVGIGAGNKPEIVGMIFSEPERKLLADLYQQIDSIDDFLKAPDRKVMQILHTILGIGYIKTGAAPASIYHFGSAAKMSGSKKPEIDAKKTISGLMGIPEEDFGMLQEAGKYKEAQAVLDSAIIKPEFDKVEESILIEMAKIFEKMLVAQQVAEDKKK